MKPAKFLLTAALLLAPFAPQLNAQTASAIVAGSSSLWLETGQGMAVGNCAWSSNSGNTLTDSRIGPPISETGRLWVVWTTGGAGFTCLNPSASSSVFAYISLESTLGVRCLFAQPQCTLATTNAAGTPPAMMIVPNEVALPASILAAFNNQPETIAASAITPADAKFATLSTLAACGPLSAGTQFVGLGYGPGVAVESSFTIKVYRPFDFNIFGTDPITGTAIPTPYVITPVGAIAELVVVNTLNPSGFGSAAVQNVNRANLSLYFSGIFGRTADLIPQAFAGTGATYFGTTALLREPPSGTYRVFEHSMPNGKELFRAMDSGNCGANGTFSVTTNPLNLTRTIGTTSSFRKRVIGTMEMVTELQAVQDSIGYAFWSAVNFAGTSNIKYLTVDGVDPLFDTYTNGAIPTIGNGLLPSVTLTHVKDGSYPIWNVARLISYAAGESAAQTLSAAAQTQVSFGVGATQPDFIPISQLSVFRAHYAQSFVNFNAGNVASDGPLVCGSGSNPEDGSDVGGLVFTLQSGADYCVLKGNFGAAGGVGPTNTASFGVRQ